MREQPLTRKMIYGTLHRYRCRECGNKFRDYYAPEKIAKDPAGIYTELVERV